jgi:hypothetical protein
MPRYDLAAEHECGELYRPGELSMPELNYCRLNTGHGGLYHSTRTSRRDPAGYEWKMRAEPDPVDWPPLDSPARQDR